MQKSIISWTTVTWNPIGGCSKVSDGCKYCYAMTLSERYKWTTKPWTIQNEAENVVMKPHKLHEPYKLKEPSRVFTNSMSDMFHRVLPDWYIAAMFCVMLDNPEHTFQVLTKRPERTVDWHEKFIEAVRSEEFKKFTSQVKDKRVLSALVRAQAGQWSTPWGENIWMGTSVEDSRVLNRIDQLRQSKAVTRFISAEPLIGAWGKVDLTNIHWVIVGGESGNHMTPDNPRWMKQEWAREIRDLCTAQGVAFFYKQDSGMRTELRPYLVEEDGSHWEWHQYPHNLTPPKVFGDPDEPVLNTISQCLSRAAHWERLAYGYLKNQPLWPWWSDNAAMAAAYWYSEAAKLRGTFKPHQRIEEPTPEPPKPTTVVSFHDVKAHWNRETQTWDNPNYVYIGRANPTHNLAQSRWANPFRLSQDTPQDRAEALILYRGWVTKQTFFKELEALRGKTLVCWCSPKACHGDVLLDLLGEGKQEQTQPEQPQQLTLFPMPQPVSKTRHFD